MFIELLMNDSLKKICCFIYYITNRTTFLPLHRKCYNFSSLFDGVIEGDFGSAFAGGGSVWFVVVDDTVFTVIDHLIITLDVGGSA